MNSIKYILMFTFLILWGCKNDTKEDSNTAVKKERNEMIYVSKAQFDNANMEFGSLVEKPFVQTVNTNGIIDVPPKNMAVISAFSGGYIKNTPFMVGDKINKGQRLVTLENPEFISMQQSYLETAEQLTYLNSEYERQKTMLEENITSQKNFLKAESEYKMAVGRSNSLRKSLQMLNINPASVLDGNIVSQVNIYSPIEGYITKVLVNTGSYVSPADEIMEIMNTDLIHLELNVFEKNLLQLKKGQEILFKVPEASQQVYKGSVQLVGTTIDPKTRVAKIYGRIDEKGGAHFASGMFVEADIIIESSLHLALPEDAVVELEDKSYVLLLKGENEDEYELHPIEVKIEVNNKGFTSFKNELPLDGKFLTRGGFVLLQSENEEEAN